jgi:ribosomal protein S6--L-glutamate ligase
MRVGILMYRHPPSRRSPVVPEMVRLLAEWHCQVDLLLPDEHVLDLAGLRPQHDLYVLKSGTEAALSVAGALHTGGARLVNPYPVTALCRDKVMTTRVLQAAGIPVPDTWVTVRPAELAPMLDDGPLVVKPVRGSQGRGVTVIRRPEELDHAPDGLVLVQRYQEPDGPDRKLYCIGGQVFGVQRSFPARTYEEKVGRPFRVDADLRDLVLRCGAALGLDLFGLDVIEHRGVPYVVDFSSFPGFKGVPNAALRLADYLYAAGRQPVAA